MKGNRIVKVKITDIFENFAQPRKYFDTEAVKRLAESISQNGLLQPLSIRKKENGYELIAGERRLRALKLLGYEYAPCIVISADDKKSATLAIIENMQREDLNVFEEAQGIASLMALTGASQTEIAAKLGLSQSAVANKLRLLRLSQKEREIITEKNLTERHARAIIRIDDANLRLNTLIYVAEKGLNVSQTEKHVEKLLSKKKEGTSKLVFKDLRIFTNTINMAVETMRRSGILASATKGENELYIEYIIRIPKPTMAAK